MTRITCFILLCFSFQFHAQTVMKISDANNTYSKDSLSQVYFDRIFSDEITEVFQVQPETFMDEWSKFSRQIAKFLHSKDFIWGKSTKVQVEVYFNADEKIELFFINVNDPGFTKEKYTLLMNLLTDFAKEYKFTIDAAKPFMNQGTITFMD